MKIAIYIILGVCLLYLAVCAFYYLAQDRFIFVPRWSSKQGELILASDFEDYEFSTEAGGSIHAIHITSSNSRGCILYFHGNTGNINRWGPIAEELTTFGFDVFLPDYRGFGKSRGKRTEENLFNDAIACYEQVRKLYPEERICIYGRSLGSAMACYLGANVAAKAMILETPFNNIIDVARYHSKVVPVKLCLKYQFRNDEFIQKTNCPVLIAHGTKDKLVPYKSALRLYYKVKERKDSEMLTIPGGKHGNLNGFPVFHQRLGDFFDRYFPNIPWENDY